MTRGPLWRVLCDTPDGVTVVDIADRDAHDAVRRARWHLIHARGWKPADVQPISVALAPPRRLRQEANA